MADTHNLQERELLRSMKVVFGSLAKVAGFELNDNVKRRFRCICNVINAKPPILARLTLEGGSRADWLSSLSEGLLGHVQEGLAASYYHLAQVESIERSIVVAVSESLSHCSLSKETVVAGGNTRRLTFEYQAFVFALRRTLEYLAVCVGAVFKTKVHRIRDVSEAIVKREPVDIGLRVSDVIKKSLLMLSDVISEDKAKKRSVRDRLAHWEAVSAGVFHIRSGPNSIEIGVVGGGESLTPWKMIQGDRLRREGSLDSDSLWLSPVLKDQVRRVERLIFEVCDELGIATQVPESLP